MVVYFKPSVEHYSAYTGSKFKDDPAGAAAAIRTQMAPANIDPTKPVKDVSKIDIIVWKEDFTDYKLKERIWAQTNPIFFYMVIGQCTQEMKARLRGRKGWAAMLEEEDGIVLLATVHLFCNQQGKREKVSELGGKDDV